MSTFPPGPQPGDLYGGWRFDGYKWVSRGPGPRMGIQIGTMVDYAPHPYWWYQGHRWLPCNGGAYSRTTYAALFAVIGTAYGGGDGWSTFNTPDTRARILFGTDNGEATGRVQHGASGVSPGLGWGAGNQYLQVHDHWTVYHQHVRHAHQHHTSGHHVHRQAFPQQFVEEPGYPCYHNWADFGIVDTWGAGTGWDDAGHGALWTHAGGNMWCHGWGDGPSQNMPHIIVVGKIIYAGAP